MEKQTAINKNDLEIRLFRIGCWMTILLSTSLLIIDLFYLKDYQAVILEGISIAVFVGFLFVAYGNNPLKYLPSYFITLLTIVDLAFFIEKGWATVSIIIYFIGVLYGAILIGSKKRKLLIFVLLTNFAFLTIIEILIFPLPKYYLLDIKEYQQIHLIFAGISTLVVVFLVRFFKVIYDQERTLIREKNVELSKTYLLLQKQNDDLQKIHEDIEKKQRKLNKKGLRLKDKNNQIEKLNLSLERQVNERSIALGKVIAELNLLFYRSSHDFRRPLTTMIGLSNVAKFSNIDALSKNIMGLVGETAEAMKIMLNKYLVLYQINDLDIYPVFSWDNLREEISSYVLSRNIDFKCSIETKNYHANDRRNFLLNIIIYQLIENCCLYRKKEEGDKVRVSLVEDDGYLNLSIWDNGQGIPKNISDNIFNLYYRGNSGSKGCGLGLYVVQTAVDKLGGTINMTSKVNEFTQFNIKIKV